jgi:hypothetical protein
MKFEIGRMLRWNKEEKEMEANIKKPLRDKHFLPELFWILSKKLFS